MSDLAGDSARLTDAVAGEALPGAYTRTAVALHWTIAALIACGFALGWTMTDLAMSPQKLQLFAWHKWIGVTVLGLAALRGLWRLRHPFPGFLPMPAWQEAAARFTHSLLYCLLFAVPLSGWAFSSASGYPVVWLGLLPLPDLVSKNKELAHMFQELHESFGTVLLAVIGLHALAAFKHHFIDRDDALRRMLGLRRTRA